MNKAITSVCLYFVYFLRDIVTLMAKIVLNVLSVFVIRLYFKKINSKALECTFKTDAAMNASKKLTLETMSKVERNLTYIGIIMCVFSSMENVFNILSIGFALSDKYN